MNVDRMFHHNFNRDFHRDRQRYVNGHRDMHRVLHVERHSNSMFYFPGDIDSNRNINWDIIWNVNLNRYSHFMCYWHINFIWNWYIDRYCARYIDHYIMVLYFIDIMVFDIMAFGVGADFVNVWCTDNLTTNMATNMATNIVTITNWKIVNFSWKMVDCSKGSGTMR